MDISCFCPTQRTLSPVIIHVLKKRVYFLPQFKLFLVFWAGEPLEPPRGPLKLYFEKQYGVQVDAGTLLVQLSFI